VQNNLSAIASIDLNATERSLMAQSEIDADMDDDFLEDESVEEDLMDMSVNARQLAIRRRIEESIEAKRIREELGFDLD